MIHHGEDFEPDSEFGNCLISAYDGYGYRIILTSYRYGQGQRENRSISGDIRSNLYEWMARVIRTITGNDEGIPGMSTRAQNIFSC